MKIIESCSCVEKNLTPDWKSGVCFRVGAETFSIFVLCGILGGPIRTLEDSGLLSLPPFFLACVLIQHFLSCLPATQMLLNYRFSVQFHRRLQLSFFLFQGFAHAVADVVGLLVVSVVN